MLCSYFINFSSEMSGQKDQIKIILNNKKIATMWLFEISTWLVLSANQTVIILR